MFFFNCQFLCICLWVCTCVDSQSDVLCFALCFCYCTFRVAGGRESQQVKLLQLRLSAQTHGQPSYAGKHTETAAHLQLQYVGNIRCFTLKAADLVCHTFQYFWNTKTHTYKCLQSSPTLTYAQEVHDYIRPVFCSGFVYILSSQESGLHWTTLISHDMWAFLCLVPRCKVTGLNFIFLRVCAQAQTHTCSDGEEHKHTCMPPICVIYTALMTKILTAATSWCTCILKFPHG